jgi:hypothetical protein
MVKIRVIKTASKKQVVQVIRYENYKRVVLKHIGSASTDEELSQLKLFAIIFFYELLVIRRDLTNERRCKL